MVAIVTKWLGPTNSRGSRIVVRSEAGQVRRIVVSWNDGLNVEDNHRIAAEKYVKRNEWDQDCYGRIVGGSVPGGYVFVFVKTCPHAKHANAIITCPCGYKRGTK